VATLSIIEIREILAYSTPASAQIAKMPPVRIQSLTISTASGTSLAFSANTNIVRLQSDANMAVAFGAIGSLTATAVSTSMPLTAGAPEYFGVTPGQVLAAITT
jgi:hypothetical protein